MLLPQYSEASVVEAGIDEAGRGCLAGPVVAAAAILPTDFAPKDLTDSKQLTHKQRESLRTEIMREAIGWGIGIISPQRIDEINILNATYEAMHEAIRGLMVHTHGVIPDFLAIDGNRFRPFEGIPFACVVKGDGKLRNIAAASILAKTFRDDIMADFHVEEPHYRWGTNKGYPTVEHRDAIREHGVSRHHRKSFALLPASEWTLF